MEQEDLRYPIGRYEPQAYTETVKNQWFADIQFLPNVLENALLNLNESQLQTPYRPGGWTVHQLVHHVADGHINAYVRFKLAYTQNHPQINTYDEESWAQTADVQLLPANISITLLYALHRRWYEFLTAFSAADWTKTLYHPGMQQELTLWYMLGLYAWHGRHHTAQIQALRQREGW